MIVAFQFQKEHQDEYKEKVDKYIELMTKICKVCTAANDDGLHTSIGFNGDEIGIDFNKIIDVAIERYSKEKEENTKF